VGPEQAVVRDVSGPIMQAEVSEDLSMFCEFGDLFPLASGITDYALLVLQ
jgi:hypothetical protein